MHFLTWFYRIKAEEEEENLLDSYSTPAKVRTKDRFIKTHDENHWYKLLWFLKNKNVFMSVSAGVSEASADHP